MILTLVRIFIFTVIWAALQGHFDVANLLMGALVSAIILGVSRPLFSEDEAPPSKRIRPFRRAWRFIVLVLVFLWELTQSALRVARIVLQPTLNVRPGIVAYPLDVRTDREITALANLITLTPGTLSLDVSEDESTIYVHAIVVEGDDGSETIREIKGSLEKHVARAFGPAVVGWPDDADATGRDHDEEHAAS
jgi:multicomponent Na+:H+ antiporter subunit E